MPIFSSVPSAAAIPPLPLSTAWHKPLPSGVSPERALPLGDPPSQNIHTTAQQAAEEAFNQSCEDAVREYQETGLHLTLEEVDAWLATWGTPEERPAPACHV